MHGVRIVFYGRTVIDILILLAIAAAIATVMTIAMKIGNAIVARKWSVPFTDAWVELYGLAIVGVIAAFYSRAFNPTYGSFAVGLAFIIVMYAAHVFVLVYRMAFKPLQAALITLIAFLMLLPLALIAP